MNKTIFLDRDGTINVDHGYVGKQKDFQFLTNAISGLKHMYDMGYQLIIVSNQSGIARGYYSVKQYHNLKRFYLKKLLESGVKIKASYYCPHLPDAQVEKYKIECNCRKPKLGMFLKAIEKYHVDTDSMVCIGDKPRDLKLKDLYPNTVNILISTEKSEKDDDVINNNFVARDLLEAATIIRSVCNEFSKENIK